MANLEKRHLAKKSDNISDWYHDVVIQSGLIDYAETKGFIIFKPYGYALWELIQQNLDQWFKQDGVQNVYFPLLIPHSLLQKEKEHLEGFSPELAIVTHAGGEKLVEPLVIRPTSETVMYQTFSKWIHSYRELPLKINQWCNVVRWEKRTNPFLRTTEFLWQEGHTAHADEADAMLMVMKALGWYKRFYEEFAAISVYVGMKSENEKFAGAKATYTVEIVTPDGKALQAATSHNLADHFAKVFDIEFTDETGVKKRPFQTSWGLSTRALGGVILAHGDDGGLIMPPRIAPIQVVVLVISGTADEDQVAELSAYSALVVKKLTDSGLRVALDAETKQSMGYRINEWELKGVPLRLEIGARELAERKVSYARRDTFAKGNLAVDSLPAQAHEIMDSIHEELFARTKRLKDELTVDIDSYDEFKKAIEDKKFTRVPWCEDKDCEAKVKEETKATSRCLELELMDKPATGKCFACDEPAKRYWLFARSY